MANNVLYSDLDLAFVANPLTGDLVPKINEDAIARALRNIVYMNAYDIPYDGSKATALRQLLFQPVTHLSAVSIQTNLEFIIKKMEPRISLISIAVDETTTVSTPGYNVTITYQSQSLASTNVVQFYLERVR